ncbi:hypothetical protein CFP56_020838 [Quercus suber]|uniref:Uncharacterized protein n=1 Tax=Quercus suber TaxID=58331 RepID=A0AAW0KEB8_QUESU
MPPRSKNTGNAPNNFGNGRNQQDGNRDFRHDQGQPPEMIQMMQTLVGVVQQQYLLPCLSSVGTTSPADMSSIADKQKANGVIRRIKIVITKKQLQELLTKQASVEDVLSGLQKKTCNNAFDSRTNWKPKLESISEGSE